MITISDSDTKQSDYYAINKNELWKVIGTLEGCSKSLMVFEQNATACELFRVVNVLMSSCREIKDVVNYTVPDEKADF